MLTYLFILIPHTKKQEAEVSCFIPTSYSEHIVYLTFTL